MSIKTLPAIAPAYSSRLRCEIPSKELHYEGGYSQWLASGPARVDRDWSLRWEWLAGSEASRLDAFFSSHKGLTAFYWKPPGFLPKAKFICREWEILPASASHFHLQARFRLIA